MKTISIFGRKALEIDNPYPQRKCDDCGAEAKHLIIELEKRPEAFQKQRRPGSVGTHADGRENIIWWYCGMCDPGG